jgi:hypothetical protein
VGGTEVAVGALDLQAKTTMSNTNGQSFFVMADSSESSIVTPISVDYTI